MVVDPATGGATAISYFWGLITLGCFLGLFLLKLFDSRSVLVVFASGGDHHIDLWHYSVI